jgi:hypothetical protein
VEETNSFDLTQEEQQVVRMALLLFIALKGDSEAAEHNAGIAFGLYRDLAVTEISRKGQ